MKITLNQGDSWVEQISLDKLKIDPELFEELWALHPDQRGSGIIFGKVTPFPRWQESYGRDYYFTGEIHLAKELKHPYLIQLLKWVQRHSRLQYNQILINWYKDGSDYIGFHSDDEKQLVPNTRIYSFSFGQERDFIIRSKTVGSDNERHVLPMPNNSLIIMGGETQKYYKHAVPKRSANKCPERRINITCRLFR